MTELDVSVLEQQVGELRTAFGSPGGYRYTYGSRLADRFSVALNMPTVERDYMTPDLPPPFEQSLPEMNLALFPTALWKFVVRDRMGLLWASSQRRIGRLRFHSEYLDRELPQPAPVRVSRTELRQAKDGEELFRDTLAALRDIPGIAGIQPKALVRLDAEPSKASGSSALPGRTLTTDSHILKSSHPDYPGATVVEALCLDVAQAAGLEVPERMLSGDGRLLAIARFDLAGDGSPLGFDEAGALLGKLAEQKYDGSLEDLAGALREYMTPAHRVDGLRKLFALCILNNALRNGDAHLKNFGLVYDDPSAASLSPVYDVLTTRCFERLRNDAPALSLSGERAWDDYEGLTRFGRTHCLLATADIRVIYERTADAISKVLPRAVRVRKRYPHASSILWLMRSEWLDGAEGLGRAARSL